MSDQNLPMPYEDYKALAKDMFESGFFQHVKNPQQALVSILAGREFGMGPFEALSNVYVIQGRPSFYANKYADMVMRSGKYRYDVLDHTNERCEIQFFRLGIDAKSWEKAGKSSVFTMEDAKKAELDKRNPNWRLYPRNMLFARALSNGARWNCPDAFQGAYTVEEMGAVVKYDHDKENAMETIVELPEQSAPKQSIPVKAPTSTEPKAQYPESDATDLVKTTRSESNDSVIHTTDAIRLTVASNIEKQTKSGQIMGEVTFLEALNVEDVTVRWPEYSVSYWIYQDKPDIYRDLKEADQVLAKLTYEQKTSGPFAGKNFQNCELLGVLDEEPSEDTTTNEAEQQQENLL